MNYTISIILIKLILLISINIKLLMIRYFNKIYIFFNDKINLSLSLIDSHGQ